jgi:HAD superfamily hydrolase (TIGR01459 family)
MASAIDTVKHRHPVPPVLTSAGDLLSRYDVAFCDVWGVVHNGLTAFPRACEALARFRRSGGTVVLVSNAPVPRDQVAAMLTSRSVPRDTYDAIVSSGDIALTRIDAAGHQALYCIGPHDRDSALFDRVGNRRATSLQAADAILCSGLADDRNETAQTYRPMLEAALSRNLPFVCANPDLVVDVGGRLYLCAGAIAEVYEAMGGEVYWAGKPHASAYGTALATAQDLRGQTVSPSRIIAIGDAVRTDLKAAQGAGVDALFIASGIHRHEAMAGEEIDPARLASLFQLSPAPAIGAMPYLAW